MKTTHSLASFFSSVLISPIRSNDNRNAVPQQQQKMTSNATSVQPASVKHHHGLICNVHMCVSRAAAAESITGRSDDFFAKHRQTQLFPKASEEVTSQQNPLHFLPSWLTSSSSSPSSSLSNHTRSPGSLQLVLFHNSPE